MKRALIKKAAIYCLISVLLVACKKSSDSGNMISVQGTISLEVHAVHHSWDVSGIMIYLKKNATDFPGKDSSIYEYKGQADGYGKYTFEKLFPGNYYIYASGYDAIWGSNVIGYMPVVLDNVHLINNHTEATLIVSE